MLNSMGMGSSSSSSSKERASESWIFIRWWRRHYGLQCWELPLRWLIVGKVEKSRAFCRATSDDRGVRFPILFFGFLLGVCFTGRTFVDLHLNHVPKLCVFFSVASSAAVIGSMRNRWQREVGFKWGDFHSKAWWNSEPRLVPPHPSDHPEAQQWPKKKFMCCFTKVCNSMEASAKAESVSTGSNNRLNYGFGRLGYCVSGVKI